MIDDYKIFRECSPEFIKLCKKSLMDFRNSKENFKGRWISTLGHKKLILNPQKKLDSFKQILKSPEVINVIKEKFNSDKCNLNHAKISLKKFSSKAIWFPHQDSQYVSSNKNLKGITIAILLEQNIPNCGNLILFKKSNKSKIKHQIIYASDEKTPQYKCETKNFEPVVITGNAGDIIVWDINTIHASKKNMIQNFDRPIFIFTIVEKKGLNLDLDDEADFCLTYNYDLKVSTILYLFKFIKKIKLYLYQILILIHSKLFRSKSVRF